VMEASREGVLREEEKKSLWVFGSPGNKGEGEEILCKRNRTSKKGHCLFS
jgi:hypothetical protein